MDTNPGPGWMGTICLVAISLLCQMPMSVKGETQRPLGHVAASVNADAWNPFFEQLKKFADKRGFAIRIAPNTPDGKSYGIEMWREDVKLVGFSEPSKFEIFFYQTCTTPVPTKHLDFLIGDLKRYLSDVKGVQTLSPKK